MVPELVFCHKEDFTKPIWVDCSLPELSSISLSNLSLIKYIHSKVDTETAELLQPFLEANESSRATRRPVMSVTCAQEVLVFGFSFVPRKFPPLPFPLPTSSSSPLSNPLSLGRTPGASPRELKKGGGGGGGGKKGGSGREGELGKGGGGEEGTTTRVKSTASSSYSFTPETLAFLEKESPMMAALAHLLQTTPTSPAPLREEKTGEDHVQGTRGDRGTTARNTNEQEKRSALFLQSLHSASARPKRPSYKRTRSLTYEDSSSQLSSQGSVVWNKQFHTILKQFDGSVALQQFLKLRLKPFQSILQWDHQHQVASGKPSSYSKGGRGGGGGEEQPPSLRTLSLLHSTSKEMRASCRYVLKELLQRGDPLAAAKFLASEPVSCNTSGICVLADLTLASAFVHLYSSQNERTATQEELENDTEPLTLLCQLSDPELGARLTLSSLQSWSVRTCIDMLLFCLSHIPSPGSSSNSNSSGSSASSLHRALSRKLDRLRTYSSIMDAVEHSPLPLSSSLHGSLSPSHQRDSERQLPPPSRGKERGGPWTNWTHLAADSASRPNYVLQVLLESRAFDVARKWATVHHLDQKITQVWELHIFTCVPVQGGVQWVLLKFIFNF